MNDYLLDKYNGYVHKMWVANCSEREAYGEAILSRDEYRSQNARYLEDKFYEDEVGSKVWSAGQAKYCTAT